MTVAAQILALLQISDSLFPSGMFTHSLGLEQLVREGSIRTPDDVERFVVSTIESSVATSDAVTAARAVRHAEVGDTNALIALDRELLSMKPAAELRLASTAVGRRLLGEVAAHHESTALTAFLREVVDGRSPGTHPVALGVIAQSFGAAPATAAALVMQGVANAVLQAAMRLLPVSHRDVQGALHRLRPCIAALAIRAAAPDAQLESFHPVQDIAAMRHKSAAVRMFAS